MSDSEEDDYGEEFMGEGGEDEMVDYDDQGLNPDQIEELKKQGISLDDFAQANQLQMIGEGGEDDLYGSEDGSYDGVEDPSEEAVPESASKRAKLE